jgi:tetratricopeptide (TPR) repeat protein
MADNRFKWEVDPQAIEASIKQLSERVRKLVDQGRYTRVRLLYKNKPLTPDIPLGALLAVEGLGVLLTGPLYVAIANLGVKAFVEVEFVHEADDRVKEGNDLFAAGEVDQAEARYREALSMKTDHVPARYHLGVLLRVTGRRDEAIACFEEVLNHPDYPEAARAAEALQKMKKGSRTL